MNYNFTDAVRKSLGRARDEAIRLRHGHVGTEHILLGMLSDPDLISSLASLGVTPGEIRSSVEVRSPSGGETSTTVRELPYDRGAKRLLEFAMRAARNRGDSYVGCEHLLIAVLEEESGIGGQVLRLLGLQATDGGKSVRRTQSANSPGPVVRIDDGSERSIYEQIVAQITEAVATGALRSGER